LQTLTPKCKTCGGSGEVPFEHEGVCTTYSGKMSGTTIKTTEPCPDCKKEKEA